MKNNGLPLLFLFIVSCLLSCQSKKPAELIVKKWAIVSVDNVEKLIASATTAADSALFIRMEQDIRQLGWQFNKDMSFEKKIGDSLTSSGNYELNDDGKQLVTHNKMNGKTYIYTIENLTADSLIVGTTQDAVAMVFHFRVKP